MGNDCAAQFAPSGANLDVSLSNCLSPPHLRTYNPETEPFFWVWGLVLSGDPALISEKDILAEVKKYIFSPRKNTGKGREKREIKTGSDVVQYSSHILFFTWN